MDSIETNVSNKRLNFVPVLVIGILRVIFGVIITIISIVYIFSANQVGFEKHGGLGVGNFVIGALIITSGGIAIKSSANPTNRRYIALTLGFGITACVLCVINIIISAVAFLSLDRRCFGFESRPYKSCDEKYLGLFCLIIMLVFTIFEFFMDLTTAIICCVYYACAARHYNGI